MWKTLVIYPHLCTVFTCAIWYPSVYIMPRAKHRQLPSSSLSPTSAHPKPQLCLMSSWRLKPSKPKKWSPPWKKPISELWVRYCPPPRLYCKHLSMWHKGPEACSRLHCSDRGVSGSGRSPAPKPSAEAMMLLWGPRPSFQDGPSPEAWAHWSPHHAWSCCEPENGPPSEAARGYRPH